jgi:hypothetical protein
VVFQKLYEEKTKYEDNDEVKKESGSTSEKQEGSQDNCYKSA